MEPLSTASPHKIMPNKIQLKRKYIKNHLPPIHAIKEMITLKLHTKRAILESDSACALHYHPLPQNGINPFPKPPSTSSSSPPT